MEDNKREMTIEELEKQYKEAAKKATMLGEQLEQKKQEEEYKKKAQLALEKEARKKEVDEAFDNYVTLFKKYINDYGSYCPLTPSADYILNSILEDTFF